MEQPPPVRFCQQASTPHPSNNSPPNPQIQNDNNAAALPNVYAKPPITPRDPNPSLSTPSSSPLSSSETSVQTTSEDANTTIEPTAPLPKEPDFEDGIGKARSGSWGACLGSKDGGDGGDAMHVRWKGCACLQEKMREVGELEG